MKKQIQALIAVWFLMMSIGITTAFSQKDGRVSPAATASQKVGTTDITISYSRPAVKGRKIWGSLVPWGEKPNPWRAGANENTTISFSSDIEIEGKKLPAGKYGLHMVPQSDSWTIIFSKKNDSWGSFSYKKEEDALRITVKPTEAPMMEWLQYSFDDLTQNSVTLNLTWEKLRVPIMIKAAK